MKIYFQKKDFNLSKELNNFSKKNKKVGSIISFVGKVRPLNNKKKIEFMEIDCYKKMALYQTKKIVDKKLKIKNYKISLSLSDEDKYAVAFVTIFKW